LGLLALVLMMSCEEEDLLNPTPIPPSINANDGYFVARAGEDRSILTDDTVNLKASFAQNQRNNSFRWRFIEKPPNSNATIANPETANISFEADQPGIYRVELGMFFEQFSSFDTLKVSAFTITNLPGAYQDPEFGASGMVRQFLVFQDKLYAVGDFTTIGGVEAYGFASFDGNNWTGLGERLLMDQVYQIIEFQNRLVISGSSREVGAHGVVKFVTWDGNSWQTLGFSEEGSGMAVYQDFLYLNFGNRLIRWDGASITYPDYPPVETITHIQVLNEQLYLRGYSNEQCVNSTEDVWVYNCEARGSLWEFDGFSWVDIENAANAQCLNIGSINWDYHIWITSEPAFNWNVMAGYQDKLYFNCGYAENGTFNDFSYPFEKIYTLQTLGNQDLYLSGRSQKTGDYTGIMKWDGRQWYTLGEGVDGEIMTIQEYRGQIYIGGFFSRSAGAPQTNYTVWSGR